MTQYIKRGNQVSVCPPGSAETMMVLEPRNYAVKFSMNAGFYLEEMENFVPFSGKLYGSVYNRVERITNTFMSRDKSTGVLLSGDAGSGKTLLLRQLSIWGYANSIPTIVINDEFKGDTFNKFIADIDQPTIVVFDEYEKIYDAESQESMLTLFDGVYTQKKMFVITCNDPYKINSHMISRPGRLYYSFKYSTLEAEAIKEYLEDCLDDKSQIMQVISVIDSLYSTISFDSLKALVEEMNRYSESCIDALQVLNIKPKSFSEEFEYHLEVLPIDPNQKKQVMIVHTKVFKENPMAQKPTNQNGNEAGVRISYEYSHPSTNNDDEDDTDYISDWLSPQNLVSMDTRTNVMVFASKNQPFKYVVTRKAISAFDTFISFR